MRSPRTLIATVAILALATGTAQSALLSKTFKFKTDTTLEIAASVDGGLRLDTVRFYLPSTMGGPIVRTGGSVRADVAVSNTGTVSQKFGIAVALTDDDGRLLGAANGGTKFVSLKAGRQDTYRLVFDGVNGEAYKATRFMITIETKP